MKKDKPSDEASSLRRKAIEYIDNTLSQHKSKFSEADTLKLIHELEVHQIELELQNSELIQARSKALEAVEKYTDLYDFAPRGYFTLTASGKIIELNLYGAKMLGKARSQLVNNLFGYFVSANNRTIFSSFLEKVFSGKTRQVCELTLSSGDEPPADIFVSAIVTGDADKCFMTAIDITELRRAQESLLISNAFNETLLKALPFRMNIVDESGTLLFIKDSSGELYGQESLGKNCWELYRDDKKQCTGCPLRSEIIIGKTETYTSHGIMGNKIYDISHTGITYKGQKALLEVFIDVTQQKHNEKIRQIQYHVAKAVLESDSIEQLLESARSELSQLFDTTNFFAAFYNPANDTLRKLHWVDEKDEFDEWEASKSFSGYVVKTSKTLLLNRQEIAKLAKEKNIPISGSPAECWLGVPLIIDKTPVGVVVIQSYSNPEAYDWSTARLFEQVARELSTYIEKAGILKDLYLAKEHAEQSDKLKSAFLANMSHEIRTPMNGILGFAGLLKEPGLTGEQQQQYIGIIEKSGARMLNIINAIIDISKIEAGLMNVKLSETNINEKLEFVHAFLKPLADKKGIRLLYKSGISDSEATIFTDKEKIVAILINLVNNAIKFTDIGTIQLGYNIERSGMNKSTGPGVMEFYVKDTGIGIPANRQKAIFDRFIQADITDIRAYGGAGLGLSISKAFVEMLGGKIRVESKDGEGSVFSFTIPYNPVPVKNGTSENSVPDINKIPKIKKLKFLIAEDDKTSEILTSIVIKNLSRDIIIVSTGTDAVEVCRRNPDIDIVLMDIQMPGISGYEATTQIRKFNKEIVIIALTAFGLSGDREKAIEAGCTDYMSKPIEINALRQLIQKHFIS